MALTYNATRLPASQTGANLSFTITSSVGNILLVGVVCDAGVTVTGVTDNLSQTYALDATTGTNASAGNCFFAPGFGLSTGVTSIKLTNNSGNVALAVWDVTGSTAGVKDTIAALNNQSNIANPNISLNAAGAGFSAGLIASVNNITAIGGSGYTFDAINETTLTNAGAGSHDQNAAGGTLTSTWSSAGPGAWAALLIELKEAAAGSVIAGWKSPTAGPSYAI